MLLPLRGGQLTWNRGLSSDWSSLDHDTSHKDGYPDERGSSSEPHRVGCWACEGVVVVGSEAE